MDEKQLLVGTKGLKPSFLRIKNVESPDTKQWASVRSYKGLENIFDSNPHPQTEARSLVNSIYFGWYHYVRLSSLLWFASCRQATVRDKKIQHVVEDFGDAFHKVFVIWAMEYAPSLFAETKQFDLVSLFNPDMYELEKNKEDVLLLSIPLTLPKRYLIPQILNFLHAHHPGEDYDVLKIAHTARYKLHTLRFRLHVIEIERLVFIYRLLFPQTPLWIIADRLQLAPSNKVRDDRFNSAKKTQYNRLNSIAGRHLYKAKRRILNVERGSFPNTTQVHVSARWQPFGRDLHADFVQSTTTGLEHYSDWQKWVHDEYYPWLVKEVLKRNHIAVGQVDQSSIPDFLSGKKNFIDQNP